MKRGSYKQMYERRKQIVALMCDRLRTTDDQMKVICLDLVKRQDKAAQMFKEITGMTMGQYRLLARPKSNE